MYWLVPHDSVWTPRWSVAPGAGVHAWVDLFDALAPGARPAMAQTPQDPVFHAEGDVWTHTVMVVDAMLGSAAYSQADPVERFVLWCAAAFHDVAKPWVTRVEGERVMAPGHGRKGAVFVRGLLWEHDVPVGVREQVCRLIQFHQLPFHVFDSRQGEAADFLVRKMSLDVSCKLLQAMAMADAVGRITHDQQRLIDNVTLFGELAHELGCWDGPAAFYDQRTAGFYVRSHGQRDPATAVFAQDDATMIMLSGLPATGKDTWAAAQGLEVVSYDAMRETMGLRHGKDVGSVVHAVHDVIRDHLRHRRSFVVNATHLSDSMRAPVMALARQYHVATRLVCLEAPRETVLERNLRRNTSLSNDALLGLVDKWEFPFQWEADAREVVWSPAMIKRLVP